MSQGIHIHTEITARNLTECYLEEGLSLVSVNCMKF